MLNGQKLSQDESIVLVLKAQTNHITHMETTLYGETKQIRTEMKQLKEDMIQLRVDMREELRQFREDMHRRFVATQWTIGIGFMALATLMSLFRFFG